MKFKAESSILICSIGFLILVSCTPESPSRRVIVLLKNEKLIPSKSKIELLAATNFLRENKFIFELKSVDLSEQNSILTKYRNLKLFPAVIMQMEEKRMSGLLKIAKIDFAENALEEVFKTTIKESATDVYWVQMRDKRIFVIVQFL